ncbi:MAG TPA: hypothetical protein VGO93_25840 [Candidatus Xenobia bacterium]|jgi:hypothetical protein
MSRTNHTNTRKTTKTGGKRKGKVSINTVAELKEALQRAEGVLMWLSVVGDGLVGVHLDVSKEQLLESLWLDNPDWTRDDDPVINVVMDYGEKCLYIGG